MVGIRAARKRARSPIRKSSGTPGAAAREKPTATRNRDATRSSNNRPLRTCSPKPRTTSSGEGKAAYAKMPRRDSAAHKRIVPAAPRTEENGRERVVCPVAYKQPHQHHAPCTHSPGLLAWTDELSCFVPRLLWYSKGILLPSAARPTEDAAFPEGSGAFLIVFRPPGNGIENAAIMNNGSVSRRRHCACRVPIAHCTENT